MSYNQQEIKEFLCDMPKSKLPQGLTKSLEEKRSEILSGEVYADYLAEIRVKAEQHRRTPIEALKFSEFRLFTLTGDRETYQKSYFSRRGRLACLALAVWLWQNQEDISALEDAIWAICDEYTWALPAHIWGDFNEERCPTVDLFSAETASALAEICALNENFLSSDVVKRAQDNIRKRVINRYLADSFGWEHAQNNWAAVCGGAVGIAVMYLCEIDELSETVFRLQTAMESYISGFPADGAGTEGLSYWSYGFTFFTAYAEMLHRMSGGKIDLFTDSRVKNIALFQQKAYFPFGGMVKFGDCSEGDVSRWWGLTSYIKSHYAEAEFLPRPLLPNFDSDPCYRWVGILRDLVWSTDNKVSKNSYHAYIFPDAQWYILSGANRSGIAVKAGHNGESHNHNDVGQVEFYLNGDEVLIDYGSGIYDRDYFGEGRYERFECGSQGHNLPIIDGQFQRAGKEFCARDVAITEHGMTMDIAPAYDLNCLKSLVRKVSFNQSDGSISLTDEFDLSSDNIKIIERFVSFSRPEVRGDKIILHGKNGSAVMRYPAKDFDVAVGERPAPRPQDLRIIYLIDFSPKAPAKRVRFEMSIKAEAI